MIPWCGLIYYLIMCASGICLFFVRQFLVKYLNSRIQFPEYYPNIEELPEPERDIYHSSQWLSLPDGIPSVVKVYFNVIKDTMKCFGAVLTIWSVAWFGFFLVLLRNVAKKDIIEIRNLLAKSTFIIGGIFNGVNLVFLFCILEILGTLNSGYSGDGFRIRDDLKIGGTCCCMLMLLSIIMVIFNSLMMNGVFHRKAKPVEVFIIFSHITFILWALCLLIGTVVIYIYLKLIWVFLAGFILFLISLMIYTLNISIILCLHSIILSSSTETNKLPIFSRHDKQIMDEMIEKIDF